MLFPIVDTIIVQKEKPVKGEFALDGQLPVSYL
jgi:hypothetical protein